MTSILSPMIASGGPRSGSDRRLVVGGRSESRPVGQSGSVRGPQKLRPVLVVDDEADARGVLAMLLEMEGYAVCTARDGVEALEVLSSEPKPCLVLLDLMMPRLDGWGVVRRMRDVPELAGVPVVLLSGVADLEGNAAGLGVAAAMTKPVDVDRLLETVQEYYLRQ
jgi:CheY-like chemotaxis protein